MTLLSSDSILSTFSFIPFNSYVSFLILVIPPLFYFHGTNIIKKLIETPSSIIFLLTSLEFKLIKRRMYIKTFYKTSRYMVFSQTWIAICDYPLLAIAQKVYHVHQIFIFQLPTSGKYAFRGSPLPAIG